MFHVLKIFLASSILLFLIYKLWTKLNTTSTYPLPPGPPPDLIIGNFRQIPSSRAELTYIEWSKQYNSDVIYINIIGTPAIILNSVKAAVALLDRRGSKYSDRPSFAFYDEQGWIETLTFMSRGPSFRKHRKILQSEFTKKNCIKYRGAQTKGAKKLIMRFLKSQEDWKELVVLYAVTIILDIAYGITGDGSDAKMYIEVARKGTDAISKGGQPGSSAVDIFPWLRKLPRWFTLIPSLELARKSYLDVTALHEVPFAAVKRALAEGTTKPCLMHRMMSQISDQKFDQKDRSAETITEADTKGVGGTVFVAAQDTTSGTMVMFILCMTLNPEVQEKAWLELDTVIGRERLPELDDREKLPYVERVLQEVYRWFPVVSQGVPHKSTEDDFYEGMFIPKGYFRLTKLIFTLQLPACSSLT
ncbi:hypothetical protein ACMFMG_001784 [Clarireedia jacksonii]